MVLISVACYLGNSVAGYLELFPFFCNLLLRALLLLYTDESYCSISESIACYLTFFRLNGVGGFLLYEGLRYLLQYKYKAQYLSVCSHKPPQAV
ncbi:hypothetical protein AG2_165 [Listeria phage vB_LmoM_AG20]|uniref:Uncharacterized protein n=1 Tax=Listeria phage vB_LmoM_AG20 TaxID=1168744 RepID=M4H0S0_9CAUD|nr:hypothetical protein AG2_165 [Listeria phage vB_LmoM_AG20]AFJ76100.1 hypothetical protein AG2_165 [Listeria phage vB_LmoM_AG20]